MKVLWFSNTPANADEYFDLELKGTGGWLKALDQEIQKKVDLHIAFYGDKDSRFKYKETNYYSIKRRNSLYSKFKSWYWGFVIDKEDINKYISIINEVNPDIIHIHGTENPFGCILPLIELPIVISIQGNLTVYHHKFLSGFDKSYLTITENNKTTIRDTLFPKSFNNTFLTFYRMHIREATYLNYAKFVIGRTNWDRRITRIMAPSSTYFHGDEILRNSFYNKVWEPRISNKIVLFTTNSNSLYKGFETLCQCLYELNKIGLNCEWRVAGIRSTDLIVRLTKKKLKDKFPKIGLIFEGNLNENEIVNSLLKADIYVMPSHIENSPNNLSEAMILGLPCIATYVGGVGSIITDGHDGILIQSGDPWVMAGAILELANNREIALKLGENARKTAIKRHDKSIISQQLIDTYKIIIESCK